LLDDSLRFNWTIYHTEVEDLQVSSNDPVVITQIVSAADATSNGVEVDLLWATPLEGLTLSFIGAYTDAEYDEFVGPCYLSQPETGTGCFDVFISAGQRAGLQDLKGQQLPLAPEWSSVVGADYSTPVGNNMELTLSAKYLHTADQFMSIERDPLGFQKSSDRIDASLVLAGSLAGNRSWTLELIGRNLTDELIHTFVNSSVLSGSAVITTNLEETKSISLRATLGF
jgi:iron complex outermembrane receptor protein